MKRSKRAGLTLMGAAPFILSACSEPPPTAPQHAFNNVEECIQSKVYTPEACKGEFEKATKAHQAQAPRFETQNACEAQYGASNCTPMRGSDGYTNWFVPAMAGFMVGHALADRPRDSYSAGYSSSYYRSEPLYRDRSDRGSWRTYDNQTLSKPSTPSAPVTTQSRGGFGSQAAARGSWGS